MLKFLLPYPVCSVVRYKDREYLVDAIDNDGRAAKYSITGVSQLGTGGHGIAWVDHNHLELVSAPRGEHFEWLYMHKNVYEEEL